MKSLLAPLALLVLSPAAVAQEPSAAPQLTAQQSATLRCSAAFAIIAQGQVNGNAAALAYPPMKERGREFFVRSAARLMDEHTLDRGAIQDLVARQAQDLADEGAVEEVMPACLMMLDASGI